MGRNHSRLSGRRWELTRLAVLRRDGRRCVLCGAAGRIEIDHIQPISKGGARFDMANLRSLCRTCHIKVTGAVFRPVSPERAAWVRYLAGVN